ncbi:3-carboxy-cis,cis-muconate cycloisomerase [Thalassobaculum litoreum]|uniref:3-carboxy-cis,cis-muconate cycloisomerase n=1 Tax=Thalassobaculum litoreum DSM 18839 TaxID=1123362 RepID=A0A8G2EX06_9PROT|nr:3-carboxy-cis,cis-muconate cycloisomerase [Thalassobaculum litoreum]SDF04477.1 3-carboxy-cis,cis-muconate cycloisomerase [Thalassobaculum litoreum DSM 18839]
MPVTAFDSALTAPLLSDPETAALIDDAAVTRAMVEVERALSRVEGRCGVIPQDAAAAIDSALDGFMPDMEKLGAGMQTAGVPIVSLVSQLRDKVGAPACDYVHAGATSQDIYDNALLLCFAAATDRIKARLDAVITLLSILADEHRYTVMAGRTRTQQGIPISFGAKVAGWLAPLKRYRERLIWVREELLVVQFGGAAGTLAAIGPGGMDVADMLADELGLDRPVSPWHTARDGMLGLGDWLSGVTGTLGKIGADLLLMGQNEVGEIRAGGGGGSSAMPQKANPIGIEMLVTLARANATNLSGLHHAAIQEHERGGPGWTLEWVCLPPMVLATAAALRIVSETLADLTVDASRMRANLDLGTGLIMAEAVTTALAQHVGKVKAQALVKQACQDAPGSGRSITELLRERCDAPVDWDAAADPLNYLGASQEIINRVLAL